MTKQQKSYLTLFILLVLIFGIPYLWRRYRDNDIAENSRYTFAQILKKTSSLKNGNSWHYHFTFQKKTYKGFWSTHVDYEVNIGDYFLVNFSSANPDHNRILYRYKLNAQPETVRDSVWDAPPEQYLKSGLKAAYRSQSNGL